MAAALLSGCVAPQQTAVADVDARAWCDDAAVFVENGDTVSVRDILLFVRYDDRCPRGVLPLTVTTVAPDSTRFSEPFTLQLDPQHSAAALRGEQVVTYRRRVVLSQRGAYRMIFRPDSVAAGIEAIGINIVKSE